MSLSKPSNGSASPCRTLSPEQREEIERQLRAQEYLRPASADELTKLRRWREVKAVRQRQIGRVAS